MAHPLFSFSAPSLHGRQLSVVRFDGHEAISQTYRFEITLMGALPHIQGRDLLNEPATLVLHGDSGDYPLHGVVCRFEVLQQADKHTFYKLVLVPRLWRLSVNVHSQLFLGKSVPQCVQEALEQLQLTHGADFEIRLQREYPQREFICQYNESHLDFISRWMEREGMYYYFEQGDAKEKIVITDSWIDHTNFPGSAPLRYTPPSGLLPRTSDITLFHFERTQRLVPRNVLLKDYNYRTPNLDLAAQKDVSTTGLGIYYCYADNVKTPQEAAALAEVRAQELACREITGRGECTIPFMRSGYTFNLEEHYEPEWNTGYLAVRVHHQGNQEGYLFSGLDSGHEDASPYYRNTFECIPSTVQFRAASVTPWPRIPGAMNAHVDAAESGHYAELDGHGRYKVTMPMDLSGRKNGHASSWVRMAQPHTGQGFGMHFPLHKSCEVMLTYADGNPDRPLIAGAAPNPEHPSPVDNQSHTQCRITTGGQNKLHFEDNAASRRIIMSTPTAESYARLGAHNDPPPDWSKSETIAGWKLNTSKVFDVQAGAKNTVIFGNAVHVTLGWEHRQTFGLRTNTVLGLNSGIYLAYRKEFAPLESKIHALGVRLGLEKSKMVDTQVHLAEEYFEAAEEHTKEALESVEVAEEEISLAETNTELADERSELAQEKLEMTQEAVELADRNIRMAQNRLEAVQENTELVENRVEVAEDAVEVYEEELETVGELLETATEQMELSEEISHVCEQKTTAAVEQNDM